MEIYFSALLDYILGDFGWCLHPVILIGKLIGVYERVFYRGNRKVMGGCFTVAVLATIAAVVLILMKLSAFSPFAHSLLTVYLLYTALAWRSLQKESGRVIQVLQSGNLDGARKQLSYIVGRDTENLDEEEIRKAVIETVSENTIDGVLAPLFYMMIGYFLGCPVLLAFLYKGINTMDSMVGYQNERYREFGYCAAKLDDLVNLIPARLGSLIMLLAGVILGYDGPNGFRIWKRDRYAHKSPNSAHPESVTAGLLGLQLGGTHAYFGQMVEKPTIGDATHAPEDADYKKTCRILDVSVILTLALFALAIAIQQLCLKLF